MSYVHFRDCVKDKSKSCTKFQPYIFFPSSLCKLFQQHDPIDLWWRSAVPVCAHPEESMASTGQTGAVQPAAPSRPPPALTQPLILPIMQTTSSFYRPCFSQLSAASAENPDVQSFNRDCKAKLREDGKGVTWKHKQGLHVHTLWD